MMKKLYVFLLVLLLVSCVDVFGARNVWRAGNIDYNDFSTGGKRLYYSSGYLSNHNLSDPFVCQIDEIPFFEPNIIDLNSDGVNEIYILTIGGAGARLQIYDFSCGLLETIPLGNNPVSMGVVTNIKQDPNPQLLIATNHSIYVFENNGSNTFYTFNISNIYRNDVGFNCQYFKDFLPADITGIECSSFSSSSSGAGFRNVTVFNIFYNHTSNSYFEQYNSARFFQRISSSENFNNIKFADMRGIAPSYFTSLGTYYTAYVTAGTSQDFSIKLLGNHDLDQPMNCSVDTGANQIVSGSNFIVGSASLGSSVGSNIVLMSGLLNINTVGLRRHYTICNQAGTVKVDNGVSNSQNGYVSNWAVNDVDYSGFYSACILEQNLTEVNSTLKCWNSAYSLIINKSLNTAIGGIALGEFDPSNKKMELISNNGIFNLDTGVNLNDIGLYTADLDSDIIVSVANNNLNNYAVYSSKSDQKVLVYGFVAVADVICGNSICDPSETIFSCPMDCNSSISGNIISNNLLGNGEACINSTECITGNCLYLFCTPKTTGEGCISNNQCLSAHCNNGKCLKAGLWAGIDNTKDEWVGTDDDSNNFISMLTLIFIGGSLIASGSFIGVAVGVGFIFGLGAFLTSVGWLSFWIYALMLIGAIIGGTIMIIFKMGSTQ